MGVIKYFENTVAAIKDMFSRTVDKADKEKPIGRALPPKKSKDANNGMWGWYEQAMDYSLDRQSLYECYDEMMESMPELAAAADIYDANITFDKKRKTYFVSANTKSKAKLAAAEEANKLLNEYASLFSWETFVKGDSFWHIVFASPVDDPYGRDVKVKRLMNIPCEKTYRVEDEYGELKHFEFVIEGQEENPRILDKERTIHFRIRQPRGKYGRSIFRYIIRGVRKLSIAEDSTVIQLVNSAPNRLAWYIDCGGYVGEEAWDYTDRVKRTNYKPSMVDASGNLYTKLNKLMNDEDIFIPLGTDEKTKVDTLYRDADLASNMKLIEHLHNKILSPLKIPRSFLSFEQNISSKAVVVEQSIEFGKECYKLQNEIVHGVKRLVAIVFATYGLDIDGDKEISIILPEISVVDDLRKWEVEMEKARVIDVLSKYYPIEYLTKYVMGTDDASIKQLFEMTKSITSDNYEDYVDHIRKLIKLTNLDEEEMISKSDTTSASSTNGVNKTSRFNKSKDFIQKKDDNRDSTIATSTGSRRDSSSTSSEDYIDLTAMIEEVDIFLNSINREVHIENLDMAE